MDNTKCRIIKVNKMMEADTFLRCFLNYFNNGDKLHLNKFIFNWLTFTNTAYNLHTDPCAYF